MGVAERFYEAFTVRDHYTMGLLYAEHATFSDPVFQLLNARGTRLMWQMLLSRAEDDFGIDVDILEDGPSRARIVDGRPAATLQVDDGFDRAWRRVGVALDRSGFTVEDRDRGQGLYFVRYVDPKFAGKEEPGLISRMLSFGRKSEDTSSLARYRVSLKGEGSTSTVSVLDAKGAPENGDAGKRIVSLLVEDLK
jgi:uncharacterized lipoprotein